MNKILVFTILAVILLSVSFTSISASPETEQKLIKKIKVFEIKIKNLLAENTKLKTENTKLKERILKLEPKTPNIITYSIDGVPSYADRSIVEKSVNNAFNRWSESNPEIDYVRVDSGGNIRITYVKIIGMYDGNQVLGFVNEVGCFDNCVITLALGDNNCDSRWSQFTLVSSQEIIMHEIGHTLGLTHTTHNSNLMYSEVDPLASSSKYENFGYGVPKSVIDEPITLATEKLRNDIQKSRNQINDKLREFGLTFDDLVSGNKTSDDPMFDNVSFLLVEHHDELVDKINCFKRYGSVD